MGVPVKVHDLGLVDYKTCWNFQEQLFNATVQQKIANRRAGAAEQEGTQNYLLLCEHPHTITLGKSGSESNLLINEDLMAQRGISFYKINRGGDITYHGPQQIVGYPILDLDHFFTDIHKYLRFLEEMVIRTLAEYGIEGGRVQGATGVWIDGDVPHKARKICAYGIRSSRWVTMHGWAFNINNDLDFFNYIIPCGINDKQVTSLNKELGHPVPMEEVKEKLMKHFAELFEADLIKESSPVLS